MIDPPQIREVSALEPAEAAELLNGVDLAAAVTLPAPAPLRPPRVGSV